MKKPYLLQKLFVATLISATFIEHSNSQTQTFTSSGTFTVPPGVTSIIVECWGGGGAGGGSSASSVKGGGGGAGGAYAKKTLTVVPGTNYTVNVGGIKTGTFSAGASGNPSWFGDPSTIYAEGGAGGAAPNNGISAGGAGSSANSIGDIVFSGGSGADGTTTFSGGGGGGAGSAGNGGNSSGSTAGTGTLLNGGDGGSGRTNEANGNPGSNYSGGGSGAFVSDNTDHNGGSGAQGLVVVSWTGSFSSSGTFTVPAGVTTIIVECWGAGGAGGGTKNNNSKGGGGGAGGAYAKKTLSVLPGTDYTVTVGTGGPGGTSAGASGNPSWFGDPTTVYAEGGTGGAAPNGGIAPGGAGSSANSIGDIVFAGGNGANGTTTLSGGGGGGAGSTGAGGNASGTTAGTGTNLYGGNGGSGLTGGGNGNSGSNHGGGGSGAYVNDNTNRSGGSGANGLVLITCCYTASMGYDYERNITIDHTKVSGGEDLFNFPVMVSFTGQDFLKSNPTGHIRNTNGYDIIFTDENYNKLDHQLEYYNGTNGDLIAWVRIPTLSCSINTVIKILYANAQITTDPSVTSVWDSHYRGVWHLDNNDLKDFTSFNKSATPYNTPSYPDGQINNSLGLNGSDQYATVLNAPNTNFAGNITVSAWVYMDAGGRDQKIAGNQNNSSGGYKFGIYTNNKVEFEIRNSSNNPSLNRDVGGGTVLNTGQWYYLAGQSSDVLDSIKTFVNGIPERPFKKTGILGTASDDLTIGKEPFESKYYFDGRFDELRISDKVRSNGWMRTEYFNQSSPFSFYSLDTEIINSDILSESICSGPITLTFGYPSGGSYSGNPYISGNIFTPPSAGTYSITYTISGGCGTLSITKDILITEAPPAPTATDKDFCTGQITYLVATSGENIRWYSGGILVSTANPFSTGQTAPGIYNYTVTQTINGCESPETSVTLTIHEDISISEQPQSMTICPGDNISFSVTSSGYNLIYQWQEDGSDISDGEIYSGATTSTLTLTNPDNLKNGKQYSCLIFSTCGTSPVSSSPAILTINPNFSWTGSVSIDWNDSGNWICSHVPAETNPVQITNVANQPVLSSGTAGSVKDLVIENGASLIIDGNTLQISGTITNNGTFDASAGTIELNGTSSQTITNNVFTGNTINNLIIDNNTGVTLLGTLNVSGTVTVTSGNLVSDGHLTLTSDSTQTALIDGTGSGEIIGDVTMQRYLPSGFGYKYFSSPYQNAKVSQFEDDMDLGTTFSMFYRYDENRKLGGNPASGWIKYNYPDSILKPMHGYSANFGSDSIPVTADITGTVNNGSLSRTLYNHNNPYTLGFNLAGNPYPSPIDWNASSGWIKTNIDGAIYYFVASTTDQYGGTYKSYVGGVPLDPAITNIIPSMQGFFVHVSDDGPFPVTGTLAMDNRVRVNDLTHQFSKSAKGESIPLLRIVARFSDDPLSSDPLVMYFSEKAETGFDSDFDALKLMNTDLSVPNLYTFGSDGSRLSINALPSSLISGYKVPLGLKINRTGNVIFNVSTLDPTLGVSSLYLTDVIEGINQDLIPGNQYSVPLPTGEYTDRFFIYINSIPTDIESLDPDESFFRVYYTGGKLVSDINLGSYSNAVIRVTNITGNVILLKKIYESGHYEFPMDPMPGIYIVTINCENKIISRKISICD